MSWHIWEAVNVVEQIDFLVAWELMHYSTIFLVSKHLWVSFVYFSR